MVCAVCAVSGREKGKPSATWIPNSLKWTDTGVPGSRISRPRGYLYIGPLRQGFPLIFNKQAEFEKTGQGPRVTVIGIYYFGGVHHLWHNPGTTSALKDERPQFFLSFQPPMGNFSEGFVNALSRRAAPEQVPFISSSLLLRYSFAFAFLGWNILWPQSIYLQS